jgi:hypothetical protein
MDSRPRAWRDILRLNDCEFPCWIGIEPGKTALQEAYAKISAAIGDKSLYQVSADAQHHFTITYKPTGYTVALAVNPVGEPGSPLTCS